MTNRSSRETDGRLFAPALRRAVGSVRIGRPTRPQGVGSGLRATDECRGSNPYLAAFKALPSSYRSGDDHAEVQDYRESLREREYLACRERMAAAFSWAVPSPDAISACARQTDKVVEVGAGNGYWAWLLRQAGIDVIAYDLEPPRCQWTEVRDGDARAAAAHPDRALFHCWPPRLTDMATTALRAYRGTTLIYVGEFMRGSADGWFFWELWRGWQEVARVPVPRWFNRLDDLRIFRRVGQ